jgi:hypothetical protein
MYSDKRSRIGLNKRAVRPCRATWILFMLGVTTVSWANARNPDSPAVTPYRPSVSTPAALSAPGWLEAEVGVLRADASGAGARSSLPYTLKLAFSPDWGVRVGGEAWVRAENAQGETATGFGDTSLVVKRRWVVSDVSAVGLELGGTFASARAGLGSGSGGTDVSINSIYSADAGALHTDVNLMFTRLSQIQADQGRVQTLWAAALSGNVNSRWGWVGELSGTRQRGAKPTAQGLCALSYSPARRVTWDGGVAKGLTSGSSSWSAFLGGTLLVGRVF